MTNKLAYVSFEINTRQQHNTTHHTIISFGLFCQLCFVHVIFLFAHFVQQYNTFNIKNYVLHNLLPKRCTQIVPGTATTAHQKITAPLHKISNKKLNTANKSLIWYCKTKHFCFAWNQTWSSRDLTLGVETSRDPFLQVLVSVLVLNLGVLEVQSYRIR